MKKIPAYLLESCAILSLAEEVINVPLPEKQYKDKHHPDGKWRSNRMGAKHGSGRSKEASWKKRKNKREKRKNSR